MRSTAWSSSVLAFGSGAVLPGLRALAGMLISALVVIWLADVVLSRARLSDLSIGILLRGSDPFEGLTMAEALVLSLGRSAALLGAALIAAGLIGLSAGVVFAVSSSKLLRSIGWAVGTAGISLPSFFWAMLLQLAVVLVYVYTERRILPSYGFGLDGHLVLPALALGARPASYIFRTTATAISEVLDKDYVRTAPGKGLSASRVLRDHVLPNAAPTVLAGLGLASGAALSSLAIIEYVFSWNGAGYAFIHALATGRIAFASMIALVFVVLFALVSAVAHRSDQASSTA